MSRIAQWILSNLTTVIFIIWGIYLLNTNEWKLGGIYLIFAGVFKYLLDRIIQLERRIKLLEEKAS